MLEIVHTNFSMIWSIKSSWSKKKRWKVMQKYSTKHVSYERTDCVNPLYLIINEIAGYIEESNKVKYLILAPSPKSKCTLKNHEEMRSKTVGWRRSDRYEILQGVCSLGVFLTRKILASYESSFQVRIRILSRKVGYFFWFWMNSDKSRRWQ